eukprot:11187858-Ditylum_brightwellii.AAC.1
MDGFWGADEANYSGVHAAITGQDNVNVNIATCHLLRESVLIQSWEETKSNYWKRMYSLNIDL